MSTLLEEPATRSESSPAHQLRTTMAGVRLSISWFGVRKTLTPDQKAQAADTFGAEGEFLSAGKKLLDNKDAAELARRLTIIETQVPSALENPGVTRGELDEARINRLFDEMAFGTMLRRRCLQTE